MFEQKHENRETITFVNDEDFINSLSYNYYTPVKIIRETIDYQDFNFDIKRLWNRNYFFFLEQLVTPLFYHNSAINCYKFNTLAKKIKYYELLCLILYDNNLTETMVTVENKKISFSMNYNGQI